MLNIDFSLRLVATLIIVALGLVACASDLPERTLHAPSLPDLGPAPDFTNQVWINTDAPLTLETLQGKVVLVEFWTYG